MMNNTATEAEYTRARTSVWWDIENCPVPKGLDAHGITQKLCSALMEMNYYGPVSISSYGNTDLIPNSVQKALSSTGISLNHVPSGRKDASDKKILVDMFLWVVENPAPANLMLISGDGDFSDALHRLRMKRYNILLAHPQQVSPSLVASAKTTWLWRSLLVSDCESSGLVDNGLYPSDSEISSQVVSEQVLSDQPMDSCSGSSIAAGNKLKGTYVPKTSNPLLQQETKRKKLQKKCSESAWFCKICNVACKSFEIFTTHLSDKEHAAQLEMKQNLELDEPENLAATPSECNAQDVAMTDKLVEAAVESRAHCGLQSVVCRGQTSLDYHSKNATMVKKQSEQALVDAKNIEESVQDSDLQSWDAQESMRCLEKQNTELTETGTTSEMSGGDFWQDFKEKMETDGVAPLNVDSVFSRVPEEVRECFDGTLEKLEPLENEIVIENLEGMPKQGLEINSGEPENAPAGLTEHLEEDKNKKNKKKKKKKKRKKKKSTVIADGAEPYVCRLCSVICDCPAIFESQLKGRKHAATIKKRTEALLDDKTIQAEIIGDNGHPIELMEELRFQPGEAPENVEERFQTFDEPENGNNPLPEMELISTELNPDFLAPKEAREWFDAMINKQELSQDANLSLELESKPNQNPEMNSGDPESSSAAATEHTEEFMEKKKKKKDKVSKDEAEAYVCSICNVICDCPIVFESHLMGRRHADGVKKHAEVLFDDKKILEESLQELLYEPEAQESIKGMDNESEQILIAEFLEPKKASERLDSIVKSLKTSLSLDDTSSQKPSEAENETDHAEKREKNEAASTQIRVCDWCNVMCSSQFDFNSHLTGKKHAATVKKHAATVKKQAATVKKKAATVKKQAATVKKQAATVKKQAATVKKQAAVAKKQAGTNFMYVIKSGP